MRRKPECAADGGGLVHCRAEAAGRAFWREADLRRPLPGGHRRARAAPAPGRIAAAARPSPSARLQRRPCPRRAPTRRARRRARARRGATPAARAPRCRGRGRLRRAELRCARAGQQGTCDIHFSPQGAGGCWEAESFRSEVASTKHRLGVSHSNVHFATTGMQCAGFARAQRLHVTCRRRSPAEDNNANNIIIVIIIIIIVITLK